MRCRHTARAFARGLPLFSEKQTAVTMNAYLALQRVDTICVGHAHSLLSMLVSVKNKRANEARHLIEQPEADFPYPYSRVKECMLLEISLNLNRYRLTNLADNADAGSEMASARISESIAKVAVHLVMVCCRLQSTLRCVA